MVFSVKFTIFAKINENTRKERIMKIAVITSGILPVPAVQGGAVEDLIDLYLEYNNIHKQHEIYVYSSFHPDVKESKALKSNVNKYYYIYTNNWRFKLSRTKENYAGIWYTLLLCTYK